MNYVGWMKVNNSFHFFQFPVFEPANTHDEDHNIHDSTPFDEKQSKIISDRQVHLKEACERLTSPTPDHLAGSDKSFYYLSFCKIKKAGSTFSTDVMNFLKRTYTADMEKSRGRKKIGDQLNIVIVRDPFERILSGYTDKFFKPSLLFWRILGRHIYNLTREKSQPTQCGGDITFPEFIKYLIHSEETQSYRNRHFYPMHDFCAPCSVHYDIIGKLETMKDDMKYIFDLLSARYNTNFNISLLFESTDSARILFSVHEVFGWKEKISHCMPFYQAMIRLWKSFQVRGFLSKNVTMPFEASTADSVTTEEFADAVFRGHAQSGSKEFRRQNKEEAFRDAFGMIPMEDLEKISKIFMPDCQLFEYNCKPSRIFDRPNKEVQDSWYFRVER